MKYIGRQLLVDGRVMAAIDRPGTAPNTDFVPSIRDLIRAALDTGRSVRDLEHDSGYRVKFQTFQELANHDPRQFPKEVKTITGMAQALNVSEAAVVLAYAKGLGVPVDGLNNTFAMRLPADISSVEPEMQNAIINMARAAVKHRRLEANPDAPPL